MVKFVCCRPMPHPFFSFAKENHSVARIITYKSRTHTEVEPSRGQLIGMELGAIVFGLFLTFLINGTDPVCRMQDICHTGCATDTGTECKGFPDKQMPPMKTYTYRYKNTSSTWKSCFETAVQWEKEPLDVESKLVCYLKDPKDPNPQTLQCAVPFSGHACDKEREYVSVISGGSTVVSAASTLILPRLLEGIFVAIFTVCLLQCFSTTYKRTVFGMSIGILILVFAILIIVFAATKTTARFTYYRIMFWVVGYLTSVLLMEPLLILIQFYVCRCEDCCTKVEKEEEKLIQEEEKLIQEEEGRLNINEDTEIETDLNEKL